MPIDDARLRWLNGLPVNRAEAELRQCCGSRRWAASMAASRPFRGEARLLDRADELWWALAPEHWLEAFRAHPRIGERATQSASTVGAEAVTESARQASWAEQEQAGARTASDDVNAALAQANRAYEERFGHSFIVCATGRDANDMLEDLRTRLRNPPNRELRVAAEEQRRITHIRLRKLLA